MNIAVRYYSKTGNTKKLAQAIAEAVKVKAQEVSVPLEEKVDVLFLGSAVYAGGVDREVERFIGENAAKIGKIYNFSTAAVASSTYKQVKKLADQQGVAMADEEFHCRGAFAILHKNRPSEEDLRSAAAFAKRAVK